MESRRPDRRAGWGPPLGKHPSGAPRSACAALAALLAASTASAQPLVTGPEVQEAKVRSIDIVDSHLELLATQARVGGPMTLGTFTTRWAPTRMLLSTGERVPANLSRTQFGGGAFLGSLEGGAFGGVLFDFVRLSNPFYASIPNFSGGEGGEAAVHAGVAIARVEVSYALAVSGLGDTNDNRDPFGNFRSERAERIDYQANTPYPTGSGGNPRPKFSFLSAYEARTGAFLSLVWVEHGGETKLEETRLHLQPLSGLVPKSIRDVAGLPAVGLRKLDDAIDYYGEAKRGELLEPGDPVPEPPTVGAAQYETDFGTDDVLRGGLRWRARLRVSPSVLFRYAELGYVQEYDLAEDKGVRVGARAMVVSRSDEYAPAGEGYVFGRAGERDRGFHLGLSYSYDSPDGATFLPIRQAHVFGVQFVLGPPDGARPLVPLVREIDERQAKGKGAVK